MTTTLNQAKAKTTTNGTKEQGKSFRLSLNDGEMYLGYVVLNKRLPKEVLAKITPEIMKQMLCDALVEEFDDNTVDTSVLGKYGI